MSDPQRLFPDPDPTLKGIPDLDPTIQLFPDPISDPGQDLTFLPSQMKFFLKSLGVLQIETAVGTVFTNFSRI